MPPDSDPTCYDLILDHARPWIAPIRLVDFHVFGADVLA
jgi:hypothetical protein